MEPKSKRKEDILTAEDNRIDGPLTGLLLSGTIVDRTRRYVPKDNPTNLIVTYTVDDGAGHLYYVDEFEPSAYYEINEFVTMNVYVKPYLKKSSREAAYSLGIQRNKVSIRGEHF